MTGRTDAGPHDCLVFRPFLLAAVAAVVVACASGPGFGATGEDDSTPAPGGESNQSAISRFFSEWFERSDRAKETQPHWMTPVVTVTPRLEQEYRYDQLWQYKPNNASVVNYGLNKGLELIPTEQTELIISVPGYVRETNSKGETTQGWADESLLVKLRMLSENEEHGNYIVSGFLGVSIPTGDPGLNPPYANNQTIWTPTIAGGKGWGDRESGFNIQSTLGVSWGDVNQTALGLPIAWNTAFQAHVFDNLWPAIEVNYTHWEQGTRAGKSQTVITPELILGRYELIGRVKFALGVAYQQPVSSFRTFDYAWILTARAPF